MRLLEENRKKLSLILGEEYDSGGAGIISNSDDYIKLIAALANMGRGVDGERILSTGTVELMRTNHLNSRLIEYFTWPELKGYGYGLGVRTMLDRTIIKVYEYCFLFY